MYFKDTELIQDAALFGHDEFVSLVLEEFPVLVKNDIDNLNYVLDIFCEKNSVLMVDKLIQFEQLHGTLSKNHFFKLFLYYNQTQLFWRHKSFFGPKFFLKNSRQL